LVADAQHQALHEGRRTADLAAHRNAGRVLSRALGPVPLGASGETTSSFWPAAWSILS
jgi:hypothetical protein